MPYKSKSQVRWSHTLEGEKALGSKLNEWEKSTDYSKLPEHVVKDKTKKSIMKKLTKNRS